MIKNLFSALVAILVSFFFVSTPALAQDASNSVLTPVYAVGSAEVSATSAAQEVCSRWQACEAASLDCDIVVQASTSNNEHVVRSRSTSFEFVDETSLTLARRTNFTQQIAWACPAASSDLDIKAGQLWPHKQPQLGYRYAWASVQPAVDAAVLADLAADMVPPPPPTACNDGEDNDGDGLVDMVDPGCETPDDQNEWNVDTNPDVRWKDLVSVILAEAVTPCPVTITGWWSETDRAFHYKVDHGYCPSECRTSDVSEKMSGYQMMSPKGIAVSATTHPATVSTAPAKGSLSWKELRTHIEAPERAPGIEYVDQNGTEDTTMWFGRAANVTDRGDLIIIDFKSVCDDLIVAELLQEYHGIDGVVLASGTLQGSVLGDGVSLTTHPSGSVVAEFGLEAGTGHTAFIGTVGWGGYFDDNCNMPAAWMPQVRLGAVFNRMGQVGMIVDVRGQYSFAPSYGITPDDPTTEENEYAPYPELGTNAFGVFVDVGPRIAFGQRGVHQGWIAPTLTAGPKLRWIEPTPGDQRVTLTGDIGASLNMGWTF